MQQEEGLGYNEYTKRRKLYVPITPVIHSKLTIFRIS